METDDYRKRLLETRRTRAVRSLRQLEGHLRPELVWWLEQLDATQQEIRATGLRRADPPEGVELPAERRAGRLAELREREATIESQVASRLLWIWWRERRRAASDDPGAH